MRKVGSFKEESLALHFLEHLRTQNIIGSIEEDQGQYIIWVHDETYVSQAKEFFNKMNEDDFTSLKKKSPKQNENSQNIYSEGAIKEKKHQQVDFKINSNKDSNQYNDTTTNEKKNSKKEPKVSIKFDYKGYVTIVLLFICLTIYMFSSISMYRNAKDGSQRYPKIARELLIDYPLSQKLTDQLIEKYGIEKVKQNNLPAKANDLVAKINNDVPWIGIYNIILLPKSERKVFLQAQLFGNIRDGQLWRLFTPAVLHVGLLHLIFNMLWLVLLGRMVEFNMGKIKYILFVLLSAVTSNVCQYMMSGPNFMGISGVLSAFVGYILVRKKIAPWEIYFIGKETIYFFLIYILGFMLLSGVAFVLQFFNLYMLYLPIANTGHISGLLVGLFLAKTNMFNKPV